MAANTDNAIGLCKAGSGADRIVLPAKSTHTLTTVNNTTYGPTGLPIVSSTITIDGNGSKITRASSAPPFRILVVYGAGDLRIQDTTVSGGVGAAPLDLGGGIYNFGGDLQLFNSTLAGNRAGSGGGLYNGGGTVILNNSTVSGNRASQGGGGVGNDFGMLTIAYSVISGNSGAAVGGVLNRDRVP